MLKLNDITLPSTLTKLDRAINGNSTNTTHFTSLYKRFLAVGNPIITRHWLTPSYGIRSHLKKEYT